MAKLGYRPPRGASNRAAIIATFARDRRQTSTEQVDNDVRVTRWDRCGERLRDCADPGGRRRRCRPGARRRPAPDGAELYKRTCAQCHDAGVGRAPSREQFRAMSPDRVLAAMETGSMVTMANDRSGRRTARHRRVPHRQDVRQRAHHHPGAARDVHAGQRAVRPGRRPRVERLGQRHLEHPVPDGRQGRPGRGRRAEAEAEVGVRVSRATCSRTRRPPSSAGACSSAAGAARSTRSTPPPAASTGTSTPARACARPSASGGSRPPPGRAVPRSSATGAAIAHALDATTGALMWKVEVDDFPAARISSSPTLYNGRLYVRRGLGRRGVGRGADLRVLQVPRQPRGARRRDRQAVWKTYMIARSRSRRRRTPSARSSGGRRARRSGPRRPSTR